MSYKTIQLSKAADIIIGFPFASEKFNINAQGIRLVRGKNITTGNLRWGDDTRWWDDSSIDLSKYMLKADDIVIGMDGSLVGKNYAKISENDLPLLLVQRVACIRAKEGYDQRFLWGCIASGKFERYIDSIKTGTSIPHISCGQIGNYLIPDFDLPTQKKIAAILSALDEKIAINRAINDNLQQQAQAIYSSMFIDNPDPACSHGHLSDLITVKYGKDHKKLADGIYPVYGSGGIMRYVERPLYNKESVLIPRKGTLNNVMYVNQPFWSVDTMFYTEMKLPNVAKFVYHFVKAKDLASMNAGSAVPSMTTDILNAMEVVIPSASALEEFESLVAPMYEAMEANDVQSKALSQMRDTLLPKLMSGEIDVSAVKL